MCTCMFIFSLSLSPLHSLSFIVTRVNIPSSKKLECETDHGDPMEN